MFKKLKTRISEELSPFSISSSTNEDKISSSATEDDVLVDLADIRPAGDNKALFSIDENSSEGSPSKTRFDLIDLNEKPNLAQIPEVDPLDLHRLESGTCSEDPRSPELIGRRDSLSSSISDASSLFPISEVPGVAFSVQQSDLESTSEWDETASLVDRLSKDTVYKAYLKIRHRYHKYKGRYGDMVKAYKDKERENEKLQDILTKTQDRAIRKVSELQEQCTLEQQAKAHLEQELRSDLEESSHKIAALQTKIKLLQEGYSSAEHESHTTAGPAEVKVESEEQLTSTDEGVGTEASSREGGISGHEELDNLSVTSNCSASTAYNSNLDADEFVEKLKSDILKYKTLLGRCVENIKGNKERISVVTQERDLATAQLQEKLKLIDAMKEEHNRELDSLRMSVESSALSMAETKKELFDELQRKEAEAEMFKDSIKSLEKVLKDEQTQKDELAAKLVDFEHKLEGNSEELESQKKEHETKTLKLEDELSSLRLNNDGLEERLACVMSEKDGLNASVKLLEKKVAEESTRILELGEQVRESEGTISKLRSDLEAGELALSKCRSDMTCLETVKNELQQCIDMQSEENSSIKMELNKVYEDVEALKSQLEILRNEKQEDIDERERLCNINSDKDLEINNLNGDIQNLEAELTDLKEKFNKTEAYMAKAREEKDAELQLNKSLVQQLQDELQKYREVEKHSETLSRELESLKEENSSLRKANDELNLDLNSCVQEKHALDELHQIQNEMTLTKQTWDKELALKDDIINNLKNEITTLSSSINYISETVSLKAEEVTLEWKSKNECLTKEKIVLEEELDKCQNIVSEYEQSLSQSKEYNKELEDELWQVKANYDEIAEIKCTIEEDFKELSGEVAEFKSSISQLELDASCKDTEMKLLQEKLNKQTDDQNNKLENLEGIIKTQQSEIVALNETNQMLHLSLESVTAGLDDETSFSSSSSDSLLSKVNMLKSTLLTKENQNLELKSSIESYTLELLEKHEEIKKLENMKIDLQKQNSILKENLERTMSESEDNVNNYNQAVLSKDSKIEKLCAEKQAAFKEYNAKLGKLQNLLQSKEASLKQVVSEYEARLEQLEEDIVNKEVCFNDKLENYLQESISKEELLQAQLNELKIENGQLKDKITEDELQTAHRIEALNAEWDDRMRYKLETLEREAEEERRGRLAAASEEDQSLLHGALTRAQLDASSLRQELVGLGARMEEHEAMKRDLLQEVAGYQEELKKQKEQENALIIQKAALAEQLSSQTALLSETQAQVVEFEAHCKDLQQKVLNMELSNADLNNKINALNAQIDALKSEREGSTSDIQERHKQELESLRSELASCEESTAVKYKEQVSCLEETISGLEDIRAGLEKQISQIEVNNAEMHNKLAAAQDERDQAKMQAGETAAQFSHLNQELETTKKEKFSLEEELNSTTQERDELLETINKQRLLTTDASFANATLKAELEEFHQKNTDLIFGREAIKTELKEMKSSNFALQGCVQQLTLSSANLQVKVKSLDSENRDLVARLAVLSELSEANAKETEKTVSLSDHQSAVQELKTQLAHQIEEAKRAKAEAIDMEDKHRSVTTELEDLQSRLTLTKEQFSHRLLEVEEEHKKAMSEQKEQLLSTLSDPLQTPAPSRSKSTEDLNKKVEELNLSIQEHESALADAQSEHDSRLKSLEATWTSRADDMVHKREAEMQAEMDRMEQDWVKERKELERLTQVAAAAFRSGTDSVELLKKQVAVQRKELEDMKESHRREVGELRALLELKKRKGRGAVCDPGLRLGTTIEEAAEYEYLRNILFQYMIGKETQTLAKVLCAIVKFDSEQQREILDQEERRQTIKAVLQSLDEKKTLTSDQESTLRML